MNPKKTLLDVFRNASVHYNNKPAFFYKQSTNQYKSISFSNLYEKGLDLAECLLKEYFIKREDPICIFSDNRVEWIITNYGILLTGAIDVPRGSDLTDFDLLYIINHSESKLVFIENDKLYEKIKTNLGKIKNQIQFVIMDPNSNEKDIPNLIDLLKRGKEYRVGGSNLVVSNLETIKEDQLCTLIYTSGTTGDPKGVMLTHKNFIHLLNAIPKAFPVFENARVLSILPIWHTFERLAEYLAIDNGAATYYTNVKSVRHDLLTVRPTFMASAPRVWEKVYESIETKVNDPKQTPFLGRILFKLAYFYSKHFYSAKRFLNGNEIDYYGRSIIYSLLLGLKSILVFLITGPFTLTVLSAIMYFSLYNLNYPVACIFFAMGIIGLFLNNFTLDKIVLAKIRQATGGQLIASVSGGGALPKYVDEFFNNIGIKVLEGYGMTETSPLIAVRTFDKLVIGSVGPVIDDTIIQIREIESGELLTELNSEGKTKGILGKKGVIFVKGPQVMKGYFKNELATKKLIMDGWMNTGDIGLINFKKTLTLTGRAKDTIVLRGGENVEPVPIENKLQESQYINQCMLVGQDQKNLGVFIVPDFEKLKIWAKENEIENQKNEDLIVDEKIREFFKKEVKQMISSKNGFKPFEQINQIELIAKSFEIGDELTNLLKLKRHVITEKYRENIQRMYQ